MNIEKYTDLLTIIIILLAIIFLPIPEKSLAKTIPVSTNKIIYTNGAADLYDGELYFNTGLLDILTQQF
jgi:hypothetical protein